MRPVILVPETDYQTQEIKEIVNEIQDTSINFEKNITIKNIEKEETKFVDRYRIEAET